MAVSGGRLYIGGTSRPPTAWPAAPWPPSTRSPAPSRPTSTSPSPAPRNGTVNIDKFDITPDGTRLIAIGNWTYVAGLQRDQIVMLDLTTSPVTVTDWATTRYQQQCAKVFDTYMRRRHLARRQPLRGRHHRRLPGRLPVRLRRPAGRPAAATPCTASPSPAPRSMWAATSAGRTTASPPTGPAPARSPARASPPSTRSTACPCPGTPAVTEASALRLVATSQGLWIGSDTDPIGRYEYHGRIPFMPLAGGTPVPESRVGTLPGHLFRLGSDGAMTRRTFTGTTLGAPSTVTTGRLVHHPRRLRGQRPPLHRPRRRHHDRPRLRRHHRRVHHPRSPATA